MPIRDAARNQDSAPLTSFGGFSKLSLLLGGFSVGRKKKNLPPAWLERKAGQVAGEFFCNGTLRRLILGAFLPFQRRLVWRGDLGGWEGCGWLVRAQAPGL